MNDDRPNGCQTVTCGASDTAMPGDPWVHLLFRYGQLLGAEDFTTDQRAFILRHRLHQALLHGAGTVWGLRVVYENLDDNDPNRKSTLLKLRPGLAIDAYGRDIYVDRELCLDLTACLAVDTRWDTLEIVPGTGSDGDDDGDGDGDDDVAQPVQKKVWVVLRYDACLAQPVPSVAPPCTNAEDSEAYSRILDRHHVELATKRPAAETDLPRSWFPRGPADRSGRWTSARDHLLEFIMSLEPNDHDSSNASKLSGLWQKPGDAPVVLAEVHVTRDSQKRVQVTKVDNSVRALLPQVQLVAEELFGERLTERNASRRFGVDWIQIRHVKNDDPELAHMDLAVAFSEGVAEKTVTKDTFRVFRLVEGVWERSDDEVPLALAGTGVHVKLKKHDANDGLWPDDTVYQVVLRGEGEMPIVSKSGKPLGDLPGGRGRDVSVVRTWKKPEEGGSE